MSVVIRLKVPTEMHYTVIPMGTSKVNSSPAMWHWSVLYCTHQYRNNKRKISKFARFKFKDFSRIFKYFQAPYLFSSTFKGLEVLFQIQAFSRISQARYEPFMLQWWCSARGPRFESCRGWLLAVFITTVTAIYRPTRFQKLRYWYRTDAQWLTYNATDK